MMQDSQNRIDNIDKPDWLSKSNEMAQRVDGSLDEDKKDTVDNSMVDNEQQSPSQDNSENHVICESASDSENNNIQVENIASDYERVSDVVAQDRDLSPIGLKEICTMIDSGAFCSDELSDIIDYAKEIENYLSNLENLSEYTNDDDYNKVNSFKGFLNWQITSYNKVKNVSSEVIDIVKNDEFQHIKLNDILNVEKQLEELSIALLAKNKYSFPLSSNLQSLQQAVIDYRPLKPLVKERREKLIFYIKQRIDEIKDRLKEGDYSRLSRQLKKIVDKLDRIYPEQRKLIENEIRHLNDDISQYKDWHLSLVHPKQLSLCEQMESLFEIDLNPPDKILQLKLLQNQWKDISKGLDEQRFWKRFDIASKKVYDSCRPYFEKQNQLKEENTKKRKEIVEGLKLYLDNTDWDHVNWQEAVKEYSNYLKSWKKTRPFISANDEDNKTLFKQYMSDFDSKIAVFYEKNAQRKKELIEKVQKLSELEPLKEAINRCKALQMQWKLTPTTGKQENDLWQVFRSACDVVFQRRRSVRKQERSQYDSARKQGSNFLYELKSIIKNKVLSVKDKLHKIEDLENAFVKLDLKSLSYEEQKKLKYSFNMLLQKARHHSNSEAKNITKNRTLNVLNSLESIFSFEVQGKDIGELIDKVLYDFPTAWQPLLKKRLEQDTLESLDAETIQKRIISIEIYMDIPLETSMNQSIRRSIQMELLSDGFNKSPTPELIWHGIKNELSTLLESRATSDNIYLFKILIDYAKTFINKNNNFKV